MEKVGIFYGTTSSTTTGIVDELEFYLKNTDYKIYDVKNGIQDMKNYKNLILVAPSYGVGDLQDDWENAYSMFKEIDFTGKKVALLGLGNQYAFGESFVGAIKILYDSIIANGGEIIGFTDDKGYHYEESESVINGKFIGLAIDEVNQAEKTPERIENWVSDIKKLFY